MLSRLSLRYRIALIIFLLEACMLASVLGITLTQTRRTADEFTEASRKASFELLANLSVTALITGEYTDYQLYIDDVRKQPSIVRIILASPLGNVVASSKVTDVGQNLVDVLDRGQLGWRIEPIHTAAGDLGTLAVQFSDNELTAAQQRTLNIALAVALGGMGVIALVGLATGFALTRRLGRVAHAASMFAKGHMEERCHIRGQDEVAGLADHFNRMADAVALQQQHLREQGEHIRLLLDSTEEGIYGVDLDGLCTFANRACIEMLGYTSEQDLLGRNLHELAHHTYPDGHPYPKETCKIRLAMLRGETAHSTDEVHWRADGTSFPVEYWARTIRKSGKTVGAVVTFVDITERKTSEERIEHLAFHDQLTGLPNRALFLDRLSQAMSVARRSNRYGAIIFIDLDQFKKINDVYGHGIGDAVLKQVANHLHQFVREGDTVARFGGDEFVILLPELSTDEGTSTGIALKIGEKLRTALEEPSQIGGQHYPATASIGVSIFHSQTGTVDDLIREADIAMYRAKERGRNTLVFFEENMQASISERFALEQELREAVKKSQFELYLQSQVDKSGKVTGAESLVRWRHPTRGLVSPASFIPLAEETGLIVQIGEWVLHESCCLIAQLIQSGKSLRLAVNVSPRQFHQADFVSKVKEILAKSGADPIYLTLEITENLLVERTAEVVSRMLELSAMGIRFSIDDFGTGYSSLSYLKRLPLNELKIDKNFVQDIPHDKNDVALVQTILSMAHYLGFEVVAEGVETGEQFEFLVAHQCEHFQGYHFHRPQFAQEWLANLDSTIS